VTPFAGCVVVKDEAALLAGCLRSLASIADEVIVVDNGSADGSAEVARRRGAMVIARPGVSHELVRNVYIEAARAPWIVVLDCDERLDPTAGREIARAVAAAPPHVLAFSLPRYEYVGEGRFAVTRIVRVFRRDARIRYFRSRAHSSVVPSIEAAGGEIGRLDSPIHHLDLLLGELDPSSVSDLDGTVTGDTGKFLAAAGEGGGPGPGARASGPCLRTAEPASVRTAVGSPEAAGARAVRKRASARERLEAQIREGGLPVLHAFLGLELTAVGEHAAAEAAYRRAFALEARCEPIARLFLAFQHLLEGDLDSAESAARRALELDARFRGRENARVVLAEVAVRRGELEEACEIAEGALAEAPRSAAWLLNVAALVALTGRDGSRAEALRARALAENRQLGRRWIQGRGARPSIFAHQVALLPGVRMSPELRGTT
jgi:tetratricopeptide (TPR) repeat protein